jgi:cation diffusion facilitator family transporter
MLSDRSGAARLSIVVIIGLIIIKIIAGVISGSLSIFAQAADSFLDLAAVIFTLLAVRAASKPADTKHPFGHGKIENFAAILQAVLIFTVAVSIIFSAFIRIRDHVAIEAPEAGIIVMAISMITSLFLSRFLYKVSKNEDSPALAANAQNIATDVYSAAAVFAGMILVHLTGWVYIDPILALLIAGLIIKVAWGVLIHSVGSLADERLPEEEEAAVCDAIEQFEGKVKGKVVGFHKLRTRKAGHMRYIDLHLVMPRDIRLVESHEICNHLEKEITRRLKRTDVMIHVDPCNGRCDLCMMVKCPCRSGTGENS